MNWSLSRLLITKGVLSPWIVGLVEAVVILAEALECAEATLRFALYSRIAQLWE